MHSARERVFGVAFSQQGPPKKSGCGSSYSAVQHRPETTHQPWLTQLSCAEGPWNGIAQAQTVPVLSAKSRLHGLRGRGICFVATESGAHLLRSHLDFAKALQEEQKRKVHVEMKTVRSEWADLKALKLCSVCFLAGASSSETSAAMLGRCSVAAARWSQRGSAASADPSKKRTC